MPNNTPSTQSSKRRKERVYEIIECKQEDLVQRVETSVLKHFETQPTPVLAVPERTLVLGAYVMFATICVAVLIDWAGAPYPLRLVAVILTSAVGFQIWLRYSQAVNKLKKATEDLRAPLLELRNIRDLLNTYLTEVDRRTSRYFHCVTNTKLTTFCVIRQMQTSVEERVAAIEKLIAWPTSTSVAEAFELLKKVLVFSDGFYRDTGQVFATPLCEVRPRVLMLMEDLDVGLRDLEELIAVHKGSNTDKDIEQPN